jgi:hypothetical protein
VLVAKAGDEVAGNRFEEGLGAMGK